MMESLLIGPLTQAITMTGLPKSGPIRDDQLQIIENAGVLVNHGKIEKVAPYASLRADKKITISFPSVLLPGLIDAHTHLCYSGSRAADYALRLSGMTYEDIASKGGGIFDTMRKTSAATLKELVDGLLKRLQRQLALGITTCEIKSGYGLTVENELDMLLAIQEAVGRQAVSLIPTCLAHACPGEYRQPAEYLSLLTEKLLPQVLKQKLSQRLDIFIDRVGFSSKEAKPFLLNAKEMGFSLVIHADQFSLGGSLLASEVGALSADHLENTTSKEAKALKQSGVIPIVLPGASLGLGVALPPARMLLDCGLPLAIASDWNPGSAPMGNLLTEAAILGAAERLSIAETFAGMTIRAAAALNLFDRGELKPTMRADLAIFPCGSYQEILYHQGSLTPSLVFIGGRLVYKVNEGHHDY